MIPNGCQDITQADIDAVEVILKSDYLTQGPTVPKFEQTIASHVGANNAVAANSATSALHIACLALGLTHGDWLWTSSITFVASANCGLYCGAKVDFVDINPQTYNLCPKSLEEKLILAAKKNILPKVVVAVHLCGQSCDMQTIHVLSKRFGFKIIEDASHCIGGKYKGEYIGSGNYSDITVFSFHPAKIITTAEGGMAVTKSKELAQKMTLLRTHGITRDEKFMTHQSDGRWYYQQIDLGFNYRMTDIQAALGISQMARLEQYITKRHEIAARYNKLLSELNITLPWQHPDSYSAFHLYVIRLKLKEIKKTHKQVFEKLYEKGIGVNLHYIPIHIQPYFQRMGFKHGDFPEAEKYYTEAISLPMHQSLTIHQQDKIVSALHDTLQ